MAPSPGEAIRTEDQSDEDDKSCGDEKNAEANCKD